MSFHSLRALLHGTHLLHVAHASSSLRLNIRHSDWITACRQAAQSAEKQAAKDAANIKRAEEGPQNNDDVTQGVANSNINSKTFK